MPDFFAVSLVLAPFLSAGAFSFAYWYVFVALQREPGKVAKR